MTEPTQRPAPARRAAVPHRTASTVLTLVVPAVLLLAAAAVAADSASAAGHARNALQAFEALPPSHPWRHHAQQLIETAPTAARGA